MTTLRTMEGQYKAGSRKQVLLLPTQRSSRTKQKHSLALGRGGKLMSREPPENLLGHRSVRGSVKPTETGMIL